MSTYYPTVGLRSVGSYQVSGIPWITGSASGASASTQYKYEFPTITKSITVHHRINGGEIFIHFQDDGASGDVIANKHYVRLDPGGSFTFNVAVKEIYITTDGSAGARWQIAAELTNIPTSSMPALTGSGIIT